MPRNPTSFGSKQDKAAKTDPIKAELKRLKNVLKTHTATVKAAKKALAAAEKTHAVDAAKQTVLASRLTALEAIPVVAPAPAAPKRVKKTVAAPVQAPAA